MSRYGVHLRKMGQMMADLHVIDTADTGDGRTPEEKIAVVRASAMIKVRYHRYQAQSYDRISEAISVVTVLGGGATVALAISTASIQPWLLVPALVVAVSQAVELALLPGRRGRDHFFLARQAVAIQKRCVDIERSPSDEAADELRKDLLDLEKDEPPRNRRLYLLCQNEYELAEFGTKREKNEPVV